MPQVSIRTYRGGVVLALFVALSGTLCSVGLSPAAADVTALTGGAFNHYTDVGLFGGDPTRLGHGQTEGSPQAPATPDTASPSVECPEGGGTDSVTDPDGARTTYGPATIFGGIWPPDNNVAPPSGPLTSEIDCELGEDGHVTASTSLTLMPEGSTWVTSGGTTEPHPGGVGPGPFIAEEVHSSCSATSEGVTSEVRIVNGTLETRYDPQTQEPTETEPIPESPEPNTTREGTIDHVGDSFRITYNEQVENPDGSLTVNAARMELLGPTAVGEMVVGQSRCGVTATPTDTTETTTEAPDTATPTPSPSPENPAAPPGDGDDGGVPLAAVGIGVLVAIVVGILLARRPGAGIPGET